VIGATVGMMCGNVQAATGVSMPLALVLGFGPMFAQMNDRIARIYHIFYTQQLNVVADFLNFGEGATPLWQSFAIMLANIAVLCILFAIVFVKKGLKG